MSNQTKPLFANIKITLQLSERAILDVNALCFKFFGRLSVIMMQRDASTCSVTLRYRGPHAHTRREGKLEPDSLELFDGFAKDMQEIHSELMTIDGIYAIHGEFDLDTK